jgi:CheY-like chemotaxis protein
MCIAPATFHVGFENDVAARLVDERPCVAHKGKGAPIIGQPVTHLETGHCQVEPLDKSMWLRICRAPDRPIDGVTLDEFQIGGIVELGPQLAGVFLAEGWARPVFVRMERHIGASTPQRLLLVVDDDEATRLLLTELFNANGYAVVLAENGEQALKQLLDYAPDLVVLDLQMPVMDGWRFRAEQQLLSNVRVSAVPVVILTGTENAAKSAEALHAAGFVEKPFEPDLLLGAVLKALKTSRRALLDRRLRS